MSSENQEKPLPSCVQGMTRQEFLKKLVTKAAVAGTFAVLLEASTVKVHPGYAIVPSTVATTVTTTVTTG